ncbi:DsbA family protein [Streptomyces sp. NP160]|uniref:DsbA family protein n=1 Tax=Streptomyces sp. NP160 TaxID=2586637 RepID=UPI00111B039F|nr:DsbA family protein [Streptomyces sp. NP160]TNM60701.1 DsbA family protein [Streptomyces sp. NP160]
MSWDRHVYGERDAPLAVVEHGDFECPYCAAAAPVLRALVDGSDGRVRLVFRHFPLFTKHPFALTAALASEEAAAQGRFWELHDLLFRHQADLSDPALVALAERAGLADPAAVVGQGAQRHREAVETDYADGGAAGVRGTPTLFVDGRLYTGRVEEAALRRELGLPRR